MTTQDELTVVEAVELLKKLGLGVDRRTILRFIQRGEVEARQLPGGPTLPYLISKSSLLKFIEKQRGRS